MGSSSGLKVLLNLAKGPASEEAGYSKSPPIVQLL